MMNQECRSTRREIDESELHQALSDHAVTHVRSCRACGIFREERMRLRDLVGSLEAVEAPPDFDFRLRARLAAQKQTPRSGFFARLGVSVPVTVAAALLLALMASAVWINQRTGTETPSLTAGNQQNSPIATSTAENRGDKPIAPVTAPVSTPGSEKPTISVAVTKRASKSIARPRRSDSTDFLETGTQLVRGTDDNGNVSLAAPVKPLVVSMEDDRGATRTFSLPPVSFGSQRLVDNRVAANQTNRIW